MIRMRTTLDFEDGLIRAAKARAAREGRSLTRLVEEALRRYLAPEAKVRKPFKLKLVTKKGRLLPGVDIDCRDSLFDRMEGRS
jgi:plasmid stability protein